MLALVNVDLVSSVCGIRFKDEAVFIQGHMSHHILAGRYVWPCAMCTIWTLAAYVRLCTRSGCPCCLHIVRDEADGSKHECHISSISQLSSLGRRLSKVAGMTLRWDISIYLCGWSFVRPIEVILTVYCISSKIRHIKNNYVCASPNI